MDKVIYYMDDNATVTSEGLTLGEKVYAIADVRHAGVARQGRGWRIGRVKIPTGLVSFLLPGLAWVVTLFLLTSLIPPTSDTPSTTYFWCVAFPSILLFWGVWALIFMYLRKAGHYKYLLAVTTRAGNDHSLAASDRQYLNGIAEAINRAILENRNARLAEKKAGSASTRH
jgi:hypothetical protein